MTSASSTARPGEVARFDALAATWWDPAGPMWPLHRLNALRVPFILSNARHSFGLGPQARLDGLSVLDIGCAAGILSESLAHHGARVTGVDPSARNIEIARQHARAAGLDIDYRIGPAERLVEGRFDVVLNMEVVEHVDDLPRFVEHCCKLVRPGGLQFLSTINRNPLSFLVAIVGAEYVLRWLPRGTHRWRQFVKPQELVDRLASHEFDVVARSGVRVNPIGRRFSLTAFEGVNYMLAARRRG
ncbi:MAG: bifunctional 2-polyprenyl-6-hydroxyphenol methylase/3-demethylubiquinol 3-O-methyltransferase UbiG [Gammaproteobacteria bacterium]|nr:bifunctional 2-polyprenyl-6-hydroxyphenol methylase/3-demethylubiquinol 3-O-methyltransferase UbiG [Gammaproteobacteria bacterium]